MKGGMEGEKVGGREGWMDAWMRGRAETSN